MEPSGPVTTQSRSCVAPLVLFPCCLSDPLLQYLGTNCQCLSDTESHRKSLFPPILTQYTRKGFCFDFPLSRLTCWPLLLDTISFSNFKCYQIVKLKNWRSSWWDKSNLETEFWWIQGRLWELKRNRGTRKLLSWKSLAFQALFIS